MLNLTQMKTRLQKIDGAVHAIGRIHRLFRITRLHITKR